MEKEIIKMGSQPTIMQMISQKASKVDLIRSFSTLSLDKIVESNFPTIGSLSRSHGKDKTERAMGIIIAHLSSSFDSALGRDQIQELCAEISSSMLRNISLEDLYLVCRKIKASKQFGKLSVNKVLVALEEHMDERCNRSYEINLNKHLSTKFNDERKNTEKDEFKKANEWYLNHINKP